jgi:peptide/nickel transport system substrate-binding protein
MTGWMRRAGWTVAAALAVAVSACGAVPAAPASGDPARPSPGGTLTIAVGTDAGCLDPAQSGSSDAFASLRQTVDSLTDQDPGTGEIVPWLATSWEVTDGGRRFTFHLRPGASFVDGTAVDAEAVRANLDAIPRLGPLAILSTGYLAGYTGTTAVDPLTAQIDFDRPNAQFLQATSTPALGLVSVASTRLTPQQRCTQGVVGSGPFTVSSYVPNQTLSLARRPGYAWGSSRWTKPGEAYLDALVFRVVPESGVRTGSLASGQLDAVTGVGRADEATLAAAGVQLERFTRPGVILNLGFNNAHPAVADVRVRQAITIGIDRRELADSVFAQGAAPATGLLARGTPGYLDQSAALGYDPDRARTLLDDAGWTPGPDGIRAGADGRRLSLRVAWFANNPVYSTAVQLVQQQLARIGVELVLEESQVAEFPKLLASGDFDALWGGDLSRADPDGLRTLYATSLGNAYRLPPSKLDTLLADQAAATDQATRQRLVQDAQRLVIENAYVAPIVEQATVIGTAADVHDLTVASSSYQLHDIWKG